MSEERELGDADLPRGFRVPREVDGAWAERRRLAAALRELAARVVTVDADEAELAEARARAEALLAFLSELPTARFRDAYATSHESRRDGVWADRSSLSGLCNPVAPPLEVRRVGDRFVAEVTYADTFEGAPGHVHGGHVAAAFDHVAGAMAVAVAGPVLTGRLNVRYRRPTPVGRPIRFEAHLHETKWSLVYIRARAVGEDGLELASAEVTFMQLSSERMREVLGAEPTEVGPGGVVR